MNRFEFYSNVQKYEKNSLKHYGTIGQKWGVRHWQNADGTFNEAGKERYFGSNGKKNNGEKVEGEKKKKALKLLSLALFSNNQIPEAIIAKYLAKKEENKENKLEEKAEKKAIKKAKEINDELKEEYLHDKRHWDEVANAYINETEFAPLFENIRKSNNEKLSKDYDKVDEIFKDYLENEYEYATRAAIARSIIDEETTLGNIGWMTKWYLNGDGDQGYANSSDLYARYEKNIDPKEIDRLYNSVYNNHDMYKDNVKYLKENDRVLSKVDDTFLFELCKENENTHNNERKNKAYWCLYDAADGSKHNDDIEKDAYEKAKKITNKLHKSCIGAQGWDYLNEAIENLDLSTTELKNMTQSDWDKINDEINKLKK